MKKQLLILGLAIFSLNTTAQNFKWAKNMGGSSWDIGSDIVTDSSGNIYTSGSFSGTADFDPGGGTYNLSSNGNEDIFITKLTAGSNFVWAKSIGGTNSDRGNSIVIDKHKNLVITGYFQGTVDFDPGTGTSKLTSTGSYDIFVLKLDSSGNFMWAKSMGGANYDIGYSITLDTYGNSYTTGYFEGTVDFDPGTGTSNRTSNGGRDIFILKLDTSGNYVWAKSVGGSGNDYGNSMVIDASGKVMISGGFESTVDFDPGSGTANLTSSGSSDIYILKLDDSGNFIWAKSMGGSGYEFSNSIAVDTSGNVYTTGLFDGTPDFDPGSGTSTLVVAGPYDIFISKLNSSGNYVWAKGIGGTDNDVGQSIIVDNAGNIYVTGFFSGTVDFDPGTGTSNLASNGSVDIFLLKLLSSGNFAWAKGIGGTSDDLGTSVIVDNFGNVYTTGYFSGKVNFNPVSGASYLSSYGSTDIFLLRHCPAPTSGSISGPSSVCAGSEATYTINSDSNTTGFAWTLPPGAQIISGKNTKSITVKFGTYTGNVAVTLINSCGTANKSLSVKVNPLPNVSYNVSPSSEVCSGTYVTFNGTGANDYTWSGGIIDGQIFLPDTSGSYIVTGTDLKGCKKTDTAKIKVVDFPKITIQPNNQNVNVGSSALFISLSSINTSNYQWQQNSGGGFVNISDSGRFSGTQDDSLKIKNIYFSDNNKYYQCIISNGICSDTTDIASLQANCVLKITTEPKDQIINVGSNAQFFVISSSESANLKWQINSGSGFVNISDSVMYLGVSNDTLTLKSVTLTLNDYTFRCIASSGGCSDTSNSALLKVNCVPNFSSQPNSQTAFVGQKSMFIVSSSSSTSTFQWQQNIGSGFADVSNGGQYLGVTDDTLIISNVSLSQNNYLYRCIASDAGCFDTSKSALLTVKTGGFINMRDEKSFSIFPNPSTNQIIIQADYIPTNLTYTISDQTGRLLITSKLNNKITKVDISALLGGFYFIKVGEINSLTFILLKQ